jgi:Zn ribbon nucleic-acid-binding protein
MTDWCKNFQSMGEHTTCKAGVAYDDVRDGSKVPSQWPCFAPGSSLHSESIKCAHCVYASPEEIAAKEAEDKAFLAAFLEKLHKQSTGELRECVHCGTALTRLEQIGRCVYARPCNCRQYQGHLPKWAK